MLILLIDFQTIPYGLGFVIILNHVPIASQIGGAVVESMCLRHQKSPEWILIQTGRILNMWIGDPSVTIVMVIENFSTEGRRRIAQGRHHRSFRSHGNHAQAPCHYGRKHSTKG